MSAPDTLEAGLRPVERRRSPVVASAGPNWFTAVMGTGIVANAAVTLPVHRPELAIAAAAVWVVAVIALIAISVVFVLQWFLMPAVARGHLAHPVMAQFYGAPPMALLTVGSGALLIGPRFLGAQAAVAVDWVLWTAGTTTGLASAVVVPLWMFTHHRPASDAAFAGWLVPLVPPMVSAAGGALLVPHTPPGQLRLSLLLFCYAEFGMSLLSSLVVIALVWLRLTRHHHGPAGLVPTLWIGLGPLGQSITAVNLLSDSSAALPPAYSAAFGALGVVYGVPVWGFALLWAAFAAVMTAMTARSHLPFSLAWWSFTFPVGTVVTGTSELAKHTHAVLFAAAAVAFYAGLVLAWALVCVRTARAAVHGTLFRTS